MKGKKCYLTIEWVFKKEIVKISHLGKESQKRYYLFLVWKCRKSTAIGKNNRKVNVGFLIKIIIFKLSWRPFSVLFTVKISKAKIAIKEDKTGKI